MDNKKLMAKVIAAVVVTAGIGALVFFKGDILLFALTNGTEARNEMHRFNAHVAAYGDVAHSPKE